MEAQAAGPQRCVRPKLRKGTDCPFSLWSAKQHWAMGRFTKCNVAHSSCGTLTVSGGGHAKGSELWSLPHDPPTLGGELTHAECDWGSKRRTAGRPGTGPREASQGVGTWGRSGRAAFGGQGGTREGSSQDFMAGDEQGRISRLASMGWFTGSQESHLTKAQGMCRRAVRGKASKWQHQTVEGLAH